MNACKFNEPVPTMRLPNKAESRFQWRSPITYLMYQVGSALIYCANSISQVQRVTFTQGF
jgi:hypothetical protein